MKQADTIFALASAAGRAGVAVVRISGSEARQIFSLCKPRELPTPRLASLRNLHNPENGDLIDRGLLLWFPAPHSFTGEDVVEIHIHGGRAVLEALVGCLRKFPSFRLAEAGEFTRRAFENDKLDLTEAEALADLVNAETEAQRRQALRQFEGALSQFYENWRLQLTKILAHLEALIDFSDEDLPKEVEEKNISEIRLLIAEITRHLDDRRCGERLRDGFSVAILGPPNAGKSSLLNVLARREAAIVSSMAGTTRDVVEVHLDLGGYPVTLADTAGLRESRETIEGEGIKRALARAEKADLKLLVFDGEKWPAFDATTAKLKSDNTILIVNKADLIAAPNSHAGIDLFISAQTGQGIAELIDKIIAAIDIYFTNVGPPALTRARHRAALEECSTHLQCALKASAAELRAEDVRLALRALGRITGCVDVEDLLDVIFRDFCIGK